MKLEYVPIYQSSISISHDSPPTEVAYGNQSLEIINLQETNLIKVDLGGVVLSDCSLEELFLFWFVYGNKFARFHLPEMVLDKFISGTTSRVASFEPQGLNIYKLYLTVNGYSKRIYLPKNLEIVGYQGVMRALADHTFYLSANPSGLEITGEYDIPVVFDDKSLTISSGKEVRADGLRIQEVLFGIDVTPPQAIPLSAYSAASGTPITPPVPVIYTWSKVLTLGNPTYGTNEVTPSTPTYVDVNFEFLGVFDDENPEILTYTYIQSIGAAIPSIDFTASIIVDKIYTVYDLNMDPSAWRTQYYRCVKQNNTYYFDVANIKYGKLASDSAPGPYSFVLTPLNLPNWRQVVLGTGANLLTGFDPLLPFERGWGLKSWYHAAGGVLKVDATKSTI